MEIDPKELIEKLGGKDKVAKMTHEQRADALEDFQTQKLNAAVSENGRSKYKRNTGGIPAKSIGVWIAALLAGALTVLPIDGEGEVLR